MRDSFYRFEGINPKYVDDNLISYFEKHEIYLNSLSEFNDPFDMKPIMESSVTLQGMKDYFRIKKREGFLTKFGPKMVPLYNKGINKLDYKDLDKFKEISKNSIYAFISELGIKCFSRELNNILLWSHYASGHRGYCIKFRPNGKSDLRYSFDVSYNEIRPTFKIPENLQLENELFRTEVIEKIFLWKFSDWRYEKETRLVLPEKANTKLKFDLAEIEAIYLGLNIESRLKSSICELAEQINKPIFQMTETKNSYQLCAVSI